MINSRSQRLISQESDSDKISGLSLLIVKKMSQGLISQESDSDFFFMARILITVIYILFLIIILGIGCIEDIIIITATYIVVMIIYKFMKKTIKRNNW